MAIYSQIIPLRHALLSVSTLVLLSSPSLAQVGTILDHSKLPDCAFDCQTLLNAQSACVPSGGAPTTNQATYQSCFCQSGYLTQFKSTSYDICNGACSAADLQTIQTWYTNLCNDGVVVTPGGGSATSSSSSSASTSVATSTSSAQKPSNKGSSHPTWIGTHYRWVIMVIVLILAAICAIILGIWLKRRHSRQIEASHRNTTLVAEEAAAALRDRHPDTPSMSQMPSGRRGLGKEVMMSGARGTAPIAIDGSRQGKGKGKARAVDTDISGSAMEEARSAFEPDSPPRTNSSRLKRKSSSRRSRSRRDR